jgi:hypothetical protein
MGGPPVYQHGLFEHSIDPSQNSLDNTFNVAAGVLSERDGGNSGSSWSSNGERMVQYEER